MARYTERSYDDIASDWDAMQRRELERRQQAATQQYANAQNNLNSAQAKKTGWLESVLSGIGNSISNVGKSLYDLGGTTIANWRDVMEGKNINKEGSYTQDFKKSLYGGDNAKDRYAKSAGTSLDAAVTLSDLIPVAGGATKVGKLIGGAAGQIGQGALSGIAQNYIDNGSKVSLEDNLKSALVGGASAGVGQKVGGKLASKVGGDGFMSKIASNNLARGALTGAAAGATGGLLSSSLNGGNIGQNIAAGLEGAGRGAAGGATMAAAMGLAGSMLDKNKKTATKVEPEIDNAENPSSHRQKAVGWDGNEINASKRNKLQALGKTLQDAGDRTKNADIYGRLNNNTARYVDDNDIINRLQKDYGYSSGDYDRAGNLSEATNRWIRNELQTSGASGFDNDLSNRAYLQDATNMTDRQIKSYNKTARQLLNDATVNGGAPGEYSAAGLYEASEKAGKLANDYYEKSHNKMDGSLINAELDELSSAYRNLKNETRAVADSMVGGAMDDVTRANLVKMLKDSGAPKEAIDTLSKANSFSELKSMTAPLEEARSMGKQIRQTMLKRGATTDTTKNPVTVLSNKAGVTQLADALSSPVGKTVGGIEQGIGKAISGVGDYIAGQKTGSSGQSKLGKLINAMNNDTLNSTFLGDLANRQIARQPALSGLRDERINAEMQQALQDAQNAQDEYNNAALEYQQAQALPQQQTTTGASNLETISNAMNAALAAGDITSYSKLADLYKQAYNIYSLQNPTETTATTKDLTAAQSKALTGLQQLETIKQMTPTLGTALAQTPVVSGVVNALGGDDYANQAQALALTLGYLQSGSNVTSKEAEKIGWSYVPTAYDSENTRQQKLTRAEQLLRNYLANTSAL